MSDSNDPAPAPSANPWRFNFSADYEEDDQYLEYGLGDQESVPDDARCESVDEEPEEGHPEDDSREYTFTVPSIEEAQATLKAINFLLRPPRNTGAGYKKCELTLYTRTRLEWVASFLHVIGRWEVEFGVVGDGACSAERPVDCEEAAKVGSGVDQGKRPTR
ncbi:hypothetical protein B0H14DRAFT_2586590 [Mycena olivaceomarginata]|nr:hypothetical protein B0H14DRAFT_2586590 [Mycena olivaceomarginata]